jgi:hypothetical protein
MSKPVEAGADEQWGLSPETLKIISPERRKERKERNRENRELLESAERHLAEAKRLREELRR